MIKDGYSRSWRSDTNGEGSKQTLGVLHADSPQKSSPEPPFAILFWAFAILFWAI